ncbi:hypothetical protein [Synechococcus sp. H55.11]|uniref:hypothetical protein n=1 Tax=Synechococcus sp. H55.11 TaxID=2967121 RepID=UPI0039C1DDFC
MEWLIFVLFSFFLIGLLALVVYLADYLEKKRREALEQVARSLGMSFSAELPEGIRSRLLQAGFELFEQGYDRRFYNSMSKRLIDGSEIGAFDYQYTYKYHSGRGKSRRIVWGKSRGTHPQSVFWAYCEDLRLPHFRLHPNIPLFHDIAKAFGMQDINFESHPRFSRKYLLRGEDEAKVRLRFDPSFLSFLEQHAPCCAEGSGPQLIVWRDDQQVSPEKMADRLRFGEEWVQRLRLRRV